jgi:hypothetical protein
VTVQLAAPVVGAAVVYSVRGAACRKGSETGESKYRVPRLRHPVKRQPLALRGISSALRTAASACALQLALV